MSTLNDRSILLACDLQQTPLSVVAAGQIQPRVHGPWGYRPESADRPRCGFNGELREPGSGTYLLGNGYRAYNPVLMCFNRWDSWSPFGRGGLNAYAYCLGDPVNRRDPDGRAPWQSKLLAFSKPSAKAKSPRSSVSSLDGILPSAAANVAVQSKRMEGIFVDKLLDRFDPIELANLRKVSSGVRARVDDYGQRKYDALEDKFMRQMYPPGPNMASPGEMAMRVGAGRVPHVPVSHARNIMSIRDAKKSYASNGTMRMDVNVGTEYRLEAFRLAEWRTDRRYFRREMAFSN